MDNGRDIINDLDECKEETDSLQSMKLKIKIKSKVKTDNKLTNTGLKNDSNGSSCVSPDAGNKSFKILTSSNSVPSNVADDGIDIDLSPKKKIKTKMSRLSLKRMLNSASDTGQSNLNSFLVLKSKVTTDMQSVGKTKKIKNSSKNLIETNKEVNNSENIEEGKVIYKISNAIFSTSKMKAQCTVKSHTNKKRIPKQSEDKSEVKGNKKKQKKIGSNQDEGCKVDKKLQEMVSVSNTTSFESPEECSMDLTTDDNLKLELIAENPKHRKCKSIDIEIAKINTEQRKNRFSQEEKPASSVTLQSENVSVKENQNAFQFMMAQRHKVIGKNSPGKDPKMEEQCEETIDLKIWADNEGNIAKRKAEEYEREEYIEFAVEKGAKRRKQLLNRDSAKNVGEIVKSKDKEGNEKIATSLKTKVVKKRNEAKVAMLQFQIFETAKSSPPSPRKLSERHSSSKQENSTIEIVTATSSEKTNRKTGKLSLKYLKDNDSAKLHDVKETLTKKKLGDIEQNNANTIPSKKIKITESLHTLENNTIEMSMDAETSIQNPFNNSEDSINLRRSSRVRKPAYNYGTTTTAAPKKDVKLMRKSKSSHNDSKIASVFTKAFPKPKMDPAILEARRIFLHSASPPIKRKDPACVENGDFDPFPAFSHTQQKTESILWNLPSINSLKTLLSPIINSPSLNIDYPLNMIDFNYEKNISAEEVTVGKLTHIDNKEVIMHTIRRKYKDFPVKKTFNLLKIKNDKVALNKTVAKKLDDSCLIASNFDSSALWTDKYKPTCSKDIIGNTSAVIDISRFLSTSRSYCNFKQSKKYEVSDDDDDFILTKDGKCRGDRPTRNIMLVGGPHGSGKTSAVYAICQGMDINVLELNASSKRTGKHLIQKLQEATQSQQIHKQVDCLEDCPEDCLGHCAEALSKMCLLLIEDIDVVYEQDEGFISALTLLLQTTKRPVILTFTHETNANVQKFIQHYPVATFTPLSAETCSVWLKLVCLLENVSISNDSARELLDCNNGDLRRTLMQLQFWASTGGRSSVDTVANKYPSLVKNDDYQFHKDDGFVRADLGKIWWNTFEFIKDDPVEYPVSPNVRIKKNSMKVLESMKTLYDALSITDCFYNKLGSSNFDLEPTFATFHTKLKDSLCLEHYEDCFTIQKDRLLDMTDFLLSSSFNNVMDEQEHRFRFNLEVAKSHYRSYRSKQHKCQEKFASKMPFSVRLDRKSVGLDYYPTLTSIVKIEQTRYNISANCRRRVRNSHLRKLHLQLTNTQRDMLIHDPRDSYHSH